MAGAELFPQAALYMGASNRAFLNEREGRSRSEIFIGMVRDYGVMQDDETVTIAGAAIRCVFTPGHTDGSVCYFVDEKYLFTGDNMILREGKAGLSYAVFNMNNDQQKASLRKIAKLNGIEAVFTMHTGYTTDFDTAFSGWKE